jgi:hypothetical protein
MIHPFKYSGQKQLMMEVRTELPVITPSTSSRQSATQSRSRQSPHHCDVQRRGCSQFLTAVSRTIVPQNSIIRLDCLVRSVPFATKRRQTTDSASIKGNGTMQLAGKIPWSWLFPKRHPNYCDHPYRMLISLVVPLSPFAKDRAGPGTGHNERRGRRRRRGSRITGWMHNALVRTDLRKARYTLNVCARRVHFRE